MSSLKMKKWRVHLAIGIFLAAAIFAGSALGIGAMKRCNSSGSCSHSSSPESQQFNASQKQLQEMKANSQNDGLEDDDEKASNLQDCENAPKRVSSSSLPADSAKSSSTEERVYESSLPDEQHSCCCSCTIKNQPNNENSPSLENQQTSMEAHAADCSSKDEEDEAPEKRNLSPQNLYKGTRKSSSAGGGSQSKKTCRSSLVDEEESTVSESKSSHSSQFTQKPQGNSRKSSSSLSRRIKSSMVRLYASGDNSNDDEDEEEANNSLPASPSLNNRTVPLRSSVNNLNAQNLQSSNPDLSSASKTKRNSTESLHQVIERLQAVSLDNQSRRSSLESLTEKTPAASSEESRDNPFKNQNLEENDDSQQPINAAVDSSFIKPSEIQETSQNDVASPSRLEESEDPKNQLLRELAALRPTKFTAMSTKTVSPSSMPTPNLKRPNSFSRDEKLSSQVIASSKAPSASSVSPMGSPKGETAAGEGEEGSFCVKGKTNAWEQMLKKNSEKPTVIRLNTPRKKQTASAISEKIDQFESLSSSEPGSPNLSRNSSFSSKKGGSRDQDGENFSPNNAVKNAPTKIAEKNGAEGGDCESSQTKEEILQTEALNSVSNSPYKQSEIIIQPAPPEMYRKGAKGVAAKKNFADFEGDFEDDDYEDEE